MKIIIAILTLWLVTGAIYSTLIVDELQSELRVEQEITKICTGELLWREMQINDLKVSQ